MTTAPPAGPRPTRSRTLREDLLDDLRHASPMPANRPAEHPPSAVPTGAPATATGVELRLTPRHWTSVNWRLLPGRTGLVLSAGPVRLSLGLLSR